MKSLLMILAVSLAVPFLPGCAANKDASAREWERAECNRINDKEARERCLKRLG
ncbi:MAG: hypothetical protein ABIR98_00220 [Usitatibacter sp.]